MDTKTQNRLQRWEKTRQQGKLSFILKAGLLAWGLPMFIVFTLVFSRVQKSELTPALILTHACIWGLTGLIYGWALWIWTEKRYQKLITQREATQQT